MNHKIQLHGLSDRQTAEIIPNDMLLLGYRGSIAHGMYKDPKRDPNSIDDKDLLGVCAGPLAHYFGMFKFEQKEAFVGEWDAVTYELTKFANLLCNANPNVLSLLWLEPQHYIYRHPIGQRLIDNRAMFVSKKIYHSFTGYAHSQLHRMTHMAFEGYMGEKRKKLVEKYGYDTKNAAHLIRLLRMGIEFLNEGELHVFRQDASMLMEIKRGEWKLDDVKEEAERLFKRAEEAYDRCQLPVQPDLGKINDLVCRMLADYFTNKKDLVLNSYKGGPSW